MLFFVYMKLLCVNYSNIRLVIAGKGDATANPSIISFTNPFLHSHSYSFRTAFMDFNLCGGALLLKEHCCLF